MDSMFSSVACRMYFIRTKSSLFPIIFLAILAILASGATDIFAVQESPGLLDEEPRTTIVFVIDVSTSMYDIMDPLKEALKAYTGESREGDSIAIITFGKSAELHYRRTIRGLSDREKMLQFCEQLYCSDDYTYIPAGLNAGVRELHQFYQKDSSGTHILVLMTDGHNNPPKDLDEDSIITYETIREKYLSKFRPGKDWFITYISLRGVPDRNLKEFVKICRGNTLEIHAGEEYVDVYGEERGKSLPPPLLAISEAEILPGAGLDLTEDGVLALGRAFLPIEIKIPLILRPLKGDTEGKKIRVEPILTDVEARARLDVHVTPAEIIFDKSPKQIDLTLTISGVSDWDETISGSLMFKPVESAIFLVNPAQLEFRFDQLPKVFIGRYSPSLNHEYDPIGWIALGPLRPGGRCTEKLAIMVEGATSAEEIDFEVNYDLDLPSGVDFSTEVSMPGLFSDLAHISLVVTADKDASIGEGVQFTGNLTLTSRGKGVRFSQSAIPLKVFSEKAEKYGKPRTRDRDEGNSAKVERNWKLNWKLTGLIISTSTLFLFLLATARSSILKSYRSRFVPLSGWLVTLESPGDSDFDNIDLETFSKGDRKSKLLIGSDEACDIYLPHSSVDKSHAQLRSGRMGTPPPVYLRYLGVNNVKVNNLTINKEMTLQDRDIIDIGEYQFLYSNSQMKQVVVHYKDGDVRYGVLLSWNIEESGFLLQPEGRDAEEMGIHIYFKDLKGVFFVKHFDKEIARKIKHSKMFVEKDHLIITFSDGEKIEGYTVGDYDPNSPRFLFVPKEEPGKEQNNVCILVERQFTTKIDIIKRNRQTRDTA